MKALLLCLAFVAGACATEPKELEVEMLVAADSVDCQGAHGPQKCLSARDVRDGDAVGSAYLLFEGIEGFDHDPRFEYHLLVARRELSDPPQNASSIRHRLIRIISRQPVD